MLPIIVREVSLWGDSLLDTALELCVLAAVVDSNSELMQTVVKVLARNLEKFKEMPMKWCTLPYDAMLMIVKSNDISAPEVTLLDLLNKWTEAQPEVSVKRVQELYGHIRYCIVPYENLLSCVIIHKNLSAAFQMHRQLSVDQVKENLIQLTPRPLQEDVFQAYPMTPNLAIARQKGKWQFMDCNSSHSVGVIYAGKDECTFEIYIAVGSDSRASLVCELSSIYDVEEMRVASMKNTQSMIYEPPEDAEPRPPLFHTASCALDNHRHLRVILNPRGVQVTLAASSSSVGVFGNKKVCLMKCSGEFPWLFGFGLDGAPVRSFTVRHPIYECYDSY